MAGLRGISLLDLIELPAGTGVLIPPDLAAQLERLSIVEYRSIVTHEFLVHHGRLQSLADAGLPALRDWPVEAPGLNVGVPFQLLVRRVAPGVGQTLEPAGDRFQLDLFLERVSVIVPGLKPAGFVAAVGTTPAHLVRASEEASGSNGSPASLPKQRVRLVGSGVLRLTPNPDPSGGPVIVRFVDAPDPLDPDAPTGPVFSLGFDPPHFFFGGSEWGMTVDKLTFDDSETFTPPDIVARGQPASWRGLAIKEATLYLPRDTPVIGDVSVGVRDVLLGSPFGLQGELRIEIGQPQSSPLTFAFFQPFAAGVIEPAEGELVEGEELRLVASEEEAPSGHKRFTVHVHTASDGSAQVRASTQGQDGRWSLPDGGEVRGPDTRYFTVRNDAVLLFSAIAAVDGEEMLAPSVAIVFKVHAQAALPASLQINLVKRNAEDPDLDQFDNVVHVSGTRADLEGLEFRADPGGEQNTWQLGIGTLAPGGKGTSFVLDSLPDEGTRHLVLRNGQGGIRRCLIEVLSEGKPVVGTEDGPFDLEGHEQFIRGVAASHDLSEFHAIGRFARTFTPAHLLSAPGTIVVVELPDDVLAEVTLELGTPEGPDASPAPVSADPEPRHVQLFFDFDSTDLLGFSVADTLDDFADLETWASRYTDAHFVLIGRCDDIGSDDYNKNLARERAEVGVLSLAGVTVTGNTVVGTPRVPLDHIHARGEQHSWSEAASDTETPAPIRSGATTGSSQEAAIHPSLPIDETDGSRLVNLDPTRFSWRQKLVNGTPQPDPEEPERAPYRRVDIYAVGGTFRRDTPDPVNEEERLDPLLRRTYWPGDDKDPTVPPAKAESTMPRLPYLVRLVVKWDSPTVVELADAIPTLVEVTIAWQSEQVDLPGLTAEDGNQLPPIRDPDSGEPEVLTFVGRWSYDARSGQTTFSLALDSTNDPEGLFAIVADPGDSDATKRAINASAAALALGPALTAGVAQVDVEGAAVRLGALLAAATVAAIFARNGRIVLFGIEIEQKQQSMSSLVNSRQRILLDYTISIGFEVDVGGIGLHSDPEKPLKVRYKDVGVELDNSRDGLDRFGLVYEVVSFEVEDPGQWELTGPLGRVLAVTDSRAGSGSSWIELDLAFSLDTGPITLTGATVRLTFTRSATGAPKVDVELRGFGVAVEVPNVLRGGGQAKIKPDRTLAAALDLEIIPSGTQVIGALLLNPELGFVQLEVGTKFATGIPLAATGLGIYGFVGRFVANGIWAMPEAGLSGFDLVVGKELAWFRKPVLEKYQPLAGQYVLGLGALVGTLPDGGFSFSALGMFTVELPKPTLIFGVDATLFAPPRLPIEAPPPSTGPDAAPSPKIAGLITKDPAAVVIGLRADYELPKVLKYTLPVAGFFPAPGTPGDFYFRVGADGFEGRVGDPVSLIALPGTLDYRSFGFLMVEERRLHRLGGDPNLNFDGFSIGYGAGFGVDWSAGPFRVTGSGKVLVGLGTKPAMVAGALAVQGELSLVVVDVTVEADLRFRVRASERRLEGSLCGSVDFYFFSVEGCVEIDIGTEPDDDVPIPDHPIASVELADRRGMVTGRARPSSEGGQLGPESLVWPDTTPVLHFSHFTLNALDAASQFVAPPEVPGPLWSGTSELKYSFRVRKVELHRVMPNGSEQVVAGPLDASWWLPSYRPGVTDPGDVSPSEHEGRDLALLSWHPAPWARCLGEASESAPGDPSQTIDRLCTPTVKPTPAVALGELARRRGPERVDVPTVGPSPGPFPSDFVIRATESLGAFDLDGLVAQAAEARLHVVPGKVEPITAVPPPEVRHGRRAAYALPYLGRTGRQMTTLRFDGQLSPAVVAPTLVLALYLDAKERLQSMCDQYGDIAPRTTLPATFTRGLFSYASEVPADPCQTIPALADHPGGGSELVFSAKGLRIRLAIPVEAVELSVGQLTREPVQVEAFDIFGQRVDTTASTRQGRLQTVRVSGDALGSVLIAGGGGSSVLSRICLAFGDAKGPTEFPIVRGTRQDGVHQLWAAGPLGAPVSAPDGRRYQFVRYRAPHAGPWKAVRIEPWSASHLTLVSCEAVAWAAADAHQRDQAARDGFGQLWQSRADNGTPARPAVLDANSTYRVGVDVEWTGWRRTEDDHEPPPIDQNTPWNALPPAVYSFRTAPENLAEPPSDDPLHSDVASEARFDPRLLTKYLLSMTPNTGSTPHLLEDALFAHFSVDHMELLLAAYGRTLSFKLRRTNPRPGALHGQPRPPDVSHQQVKIPFAKELHAPSDQRMIDAGAANGCLGSLAPPLGGSSYFMPANLEPGAEYDLLLVAPPAATPQSDDVLVARAHFRASRYRSPAELMAGLGLSTTDVTPLAPNDALVTEAPPTIATLADDRALDDTLDQLGLDPWPIATQPRVSLLWLSSGGFRLAGVFLEADEPLQRGTRMSITSASVGSATMVPVRSSHSGQRVLLAPVGGPITVPPDAPLVVTVAHQVGTLVGRRFIYDRPRFAMLEGA